MQTSPANGKSKSKRKEFAPSGRVQLTRLITGTMYVDRGYEPVHRSLKLYFSFSW